MTAIILFKQICSSNNLHSIFYICTGQKCVWTQSCITTHLHARTFCALFMLVSASSQALWKKHSHLNIQLSLPSNKCDGSYHLTSFKLSLYIITHYFYYENIKNNLTEIIFNKQNFSCVDKATKQRSSCWILFEWQMWLFSPWEHLTGLAGPTTQGRLKV